ncbi:sulfite exporter TauE/SafE family protein [Leifsonia sp. SIMBA_070]|uniref:sulfite exporter TauE/SafE family protein n=1 Tax=Leifsonia sp. SIMBA_070 TaxID=3085810 RepID=UPI00397DE8F6
MLLAVAAFGLLVGAVLGLVGAGGAIIAVPALVYVVGVPVAEAMSTSLVMAASSSVAAVLPRLRHGINWRIATTVGVVGIPAAFLGTAVNAALPQPVVLLGFATLMIVAGIQMLRPRPSASGERPPGRGWVWRAVLVGLAVGLLTGLLGVGGGFVIVPALVLLLRMPIGAAIGTSLIITIVNSIAGVIAHAGVGSVDWQITVAFAAPAFLASLIAARFATRLSGRMLQVAFAVLVLAIALLTIVRTILTW